MKKLIRTLDFYEFDGGEVVIESDDAKFSANKENTNRTISKDEEYKVVNRMGK